MKTEAGYQATQRQDVRGDAGAHAWFLTRWRSWHGAFKFQSPEPVAQRKIHSEGEQLSPSNTSPVPLAVGGDVAGLPRCDPLGLGRNRKPGSPSVRNGVRG